MHTKKILKWVLIVLSVPIVLFFLLAVALYLPPIQDWAVGKAAAYASEQAQMNVSIRKLRLSFPIDLRSEWVLATKPSSNNGTDTIASIESFTAGIRMLPLLTGKVVIDEFRVCNARFFTSDLVDAARISGIVGQMSLASHGIDLKTSLACLDDVVLKDGYVAISLADSVPEDTTESEPSDWQLAINKVDIENVGVRFSMNSDTLVAKMQIDHASTSDVDIRLSDSFYRVGKTGIDITALTYDNGLVSSIPLSVLDGEATELDFNHLRLNSLSFAADSMLYADPKAILALSGFAFEEQSGLSLKSAAGVLTMDSSRVEVPSFTLRTASSAINASLTADISAFDSIPNGQFHVSVSGDLSPDDIIVFLASAPDRFKKRWPRVPMRVGFEAEGNMAEVNISKIEASLPGAFRASLAGRVGNLASLENLQAKISLDAATQDMSFATAWLDPSTASSIRIPNGITADATAEIDGSAYQIGICASQGGGWIKADGSIDTKRQTYSVAAAAKNLLIRNFMPSLPVNGFSGKVEAEGHSFDITSPRSSMDAHAQVDGLAYQQRQLGQMKLDASLNNGKALIDFNSGDSLILGRLSLDALISQRQFSGTIAADVQQIDLYSLGFTPKPFAVGLCGYVDATSDYKKNHKIEASLSDISLRDSAEVFHPCDLDLALTARPDTTDMRLSTGDLNMNVQLAGDYETLMASSGDMLEEISRQLSERYIDYPKLRANFPVAHIDVSGGTDNIVSRLLSYYGIGINAIEADLSSSPISGINGMAEINSITASGITIDYTRLKLSSSDEHINYDLQVKNSSAGNPYLFNALLDGSMAGNQATCRARIYDKADSLGLSLALKAMMDNDGVGLSISDLDPVIGYKTFAANADNKIFLAANRRVTANVKLLASDGTGVMIYSDDDNTEALQDITLSLHQIDLGSIMAAIPYAPNVEGMFSGDFHAIQTEENLSLSTEFGIDSLVYEHNSMGDIGAELVYMPLPDGSHHVDGIFSNDGTEVATIDGNYNLQTSRLDAEMQLDKFPLRYANGFVPDHIIGLRGLGAGELSLKGHIDSLDINGELVFDDAALYSLPYGIDMRFDESPVKVKNSMLRLDKFAMYAKDNSPLYLNGTLDFSDLAAMTLNVTMQAKDFKVIDAKENSRSETFGKAFVDFFASAKGPLESLRIQGLLKVLGSTDMTYILRDSPLTTDNQLDELVKFTDFSDTTSTQSVSRPPIEGLSMDLNINVDESARILCALNAAKTNYVDLVGSGNLRMQYTGGDIRLTGQYTLNNGEMKYSLPIIPLKTFTIQDGSSVEFTGDPFNPKLDITATEQVKASVSSDDGSSRTVTFTTGVVISKTLSDMGLEFTIDAPEDLSLHNELQTMSLENRGKIAVTMLTTGMYLADGNTNSFSMNSALSAFLNSQINNISAGALRSLDMSFDMTGSVGSSGEEHTDYSFKFAKRFWNNRLRIVVGGKLSSGDEAENQNDSFFDNVTFEYRLSNQSNKYLNLFYKRDSYDWLEGYVTEFGVGFLWKRKMQRLGDLFRIKSPMKAAPMKTGSVGVKSDSIR